MHAEIHMVLKFGPRDPVAGYFNDGNPPLMFPPAGWPPLNVHLDSSARPGATRLPIIGLDYVLF